MASVASLFLIVIAGCAEQPTANVQIVQPVEGDTVDGPNVSVALWATGVEIAPAAEQRPGTAHHHLFVDHDLTPLGDTIPSGVTGIIHLGRGQTEFTLEGLAPGRHRVIDVLANSGHVPLDPAVADTVTFVVRAAGADSASSQGS